ncbi:LiaI-LiaF-like domain-containing protein [Halarsenatibacter silvermanii]|uniref:LiaI-LiaF-like transmembrane region domain-containing protein n=1 Tax=Halarsenatibacter silvermanii TaxID=321763 RepID=A0A1G9QEZ1_9FIRM|nr:DUF5668 domain-containing protein [Halarsenatibacter silvermanii]SDM09321.1 hypothetical protein SAMN04488692_11652 [Halarsenatibacter silvermanii]
MGESRYSRADITFGIFLIGTGILFLLDTFGYLGFDFWSLLMRSWPLFLILLGMNIIFRGTKLWWITPLLLIIIFVGLLFPNPANPIYWHMVGRTGQQVEKSTETLGEEMTYDSEIEKLLVKFNVEAGGLDVKPLFPEEEGDKLYELNFEYGEMKPEIDYDYDSQDRLGRLSIYQQQRFELEEMDFINHAVLQLSDRLPHELKIESGAGHYELKLRDLEISSLDINSGVSDLEIYFGRYSSDVNISSGASDMTFYLPDEVGLKIDTENVVSSNNFADVDLEEVDPSTYLSKNFQEADEKITIEVASPASSIEVVFD